MEVILFALAFAVLSIITLYIILTPGIRAMKISNGIMNQDTFSREYLFKVNYTKNDFLQKINIANSDDVLEYNFDNNSMIVTFSKYGAHIPYAVFIKEIADGCYIRLKKNVLIGDRSNIPFYINEFMIKKFSAEPIPYEEYKDIIT